MKRIVLIFGAACVLLVSSPAQAMIIFNEFLADPPAGVDVNGDGVASTSQDEFVELLNFSGTAVDLSSWSIEDAVGTRHVFALGTLLPSHEFLVVFGGGVPALSGVNTTTASTGSLGLNNSGDIISLFDENGNLIDRVSYGSEGGRDQSLVRFPEGTGTEFILHSLAHDSQDELFSPGTTTDGETIYQPGISNASVPEPATAISFLVGILGLNQRRKKA